jgi:predicted nucleic acid-binding protein
LSLDTNVLSEPMRPRPARNFEAWVGAQPATSLFTTAITQAEILYGLALLPAGRRRDGLVAVADAIFEVDLAAHVLPFDGSAAREFAAIAATCRQAGRPMAQADGQSAAVARSRGAALATCNIADFGRCGIRLIDPWHA